MYVLSQDLNGRSDISSYFDEDLFNSSIIYQFPKTSDVKYTMGYRSREDLISSDVYNNSNYLGVVLYSVGETIKKDDEGNVETLPEFEPLNVISLKNLNELRSSQLVTVVQNPITLKEINPLRNPEHEYYILQSKRFQPVSSNRE